MMFSNSVLFNRQQITALATANFRLFEGMISRSQIPVRSALVAVLAPALLLGGKVVAQTPGSTVESAFGNPSATKEPAPSETETTKPPPKPGEEGYKVGVADNTRVGSLPEFTQGLSFKAAKAFAKGDWQAARIAYSQILEEDPRNALALTNLATVEHRSGDDESALGHLKRALEANPKIAQAWVLQGLIQFQKGDSNLAVSSLTRALHEDPLDPRAHNYLGVVVKEMGWLHGAEQELQRAIELSPGYADAHFNLALLYLDKRPPARELAKRHYDMAIELGSKPDKLAEKKIAGEE